MDSFTNKENAVINKDAAEKLIMAAETVMCLARDTVFINKPYFSRAANNLDFKNLKIDDETNIMTDGRFAYYNPVFVAKTYREQRGNEASVRNYLHMLLHCICLHMFVGDVDTELWDLASDIAVESIINELDIESASTPKARYQKAVETELAKRIPSLTAERIYKLLKSGKISDSSIKDWRKYYEADNHDVWYMSDAEKQERYGIGGSESNIQITIASGETVVNGSSQHWKDIASHLREEMQHFNQMGRGDYGGTLTMNIDEMSRERYDYTSFLEKFAVMGEEMQLNHDEFDYIPYTYGLREYGNLLFIEPLEYKDVKRIKDFVIAIDTSGSVSGKLVQTFMKKTYNILKSTESFFSKINLHIIQCDAEIQSSIKITSAEEFEDYIKNVKLKGFGGTDFRPVFQYVDQMKENGEFTNLKGMIYFTDGYGIFPNQAPDYEAAFVFIDYGLGETYASPAVPSWAIKLVLEEKDIK